MIEGVDKDACKAKKIDGGGVRTSKSGQSAARTSSKINHQTFTKLRNSISKFIGKTKLKMGRFRSIFGRILPSFAADLRPSKQQLRSKFPPRDSQTRFSRRKILSARLSQKSLNRLGLRRSDAGYVLILVVAALPVLLFGAKYILDQQTLSGRRATGTEYVKDSSLGSQRLVKQCAQEAALEVAKHWNPGLTLYQQRESMLRIADEVYNAAPTYVDSTVIRAVHGLDVARESTTQGRTYEPIKITRTSDTRLSPSLRTVEYQEETNNYIIGYTKKKKRTLVYPIFSVFRSFYLFEDRDSALVLEDTVKEYTMYCTEDSTSCYQNPTYVIRSSNDDAMRNSGISYAGTDSTQGTRKATVKRRKNSDDNKVKIEVVDDKIKVTTDDDVSYAVPAECNVDIVLGIPVNGAANNTDNLDSNTLTSGNPYYRGPNSPDDGLDGLKTPISQISLAFHDFVKNNFHYTRGVNVGIVPYCGMVSLPENRIETWAKDPDNFDRTVFPENQNTYWAYIRPCMLYGLFGGNGNIKKFDPHYGVSFSWTNVMVPQGKKERVSEYGNNWIYYGDVLSTNDPAGSVTASYSPKFMRRPTWKIPAFPGRFNFLSMDFESLDGQNYVWCNPYNIVEMQSDLLKITDLLNLFYPFNFDSNGLSNFVFVPFVWANNLFQSWSKDPKYDAADTTQATPSAMTNANSGRLSAPSKTTAGRKKALILVVNKPDWFEPGELTYLGFDNDFSEIPMIESDCIRGDIDYSDTTKYFADGTKYNTGDNQIDGQPLVAGAKKIIKLTGFTRNATTGYYECNGDTPTSATLTFPQKYLVKVVVDVLPSNKYVAVAYNSDKGAYSTDGINWRDVNLPEKRDWQSVGCGDGKFIALAYNTDKAAYSEDGINWRDVDLPSSNYWRSVCYGGGQFVAVSSGSSGAYSTDGINWTEMQQPTFLNALCYGNGKFVGTAYSNKGAWSEDGINWTSMNMPSTYSWYSSCYGNGKFVVENGADNDIALWSEDGINWTQTTMPASLGWYVSYGNGKFVAVGNRSDKAAYSDDGITWEETTLPASTYWQLLCYGGGKFIATGNTKKIAYSTDGITWKETNISTSRNWCSMCCSIDKPNSKIRFTNITGNSDHCTQADTEYKITEKKEFFIEPDQISDPSTEGGEYEITFDASNLRLISAEITNRPYTRVTPTVTRNGDVYTLNAKVPFVVTVNRTGTFTYTTPDGIQMTKNTTGGWGYHQVTPETHRYEKGFNADGTPYYTVTVPFAGTNPLFAAAVGIAEERSESVNLDPGLDWEAEGTKPKVAIGDYLSYQKTDFADSTGEATVDAANGKIYCPIGTVLHVKAVPHGSVTFHGENNIDLAGITATPTSMPDTPENAPASITTTNARTFTITGPTKFHFAGGENEVDEYSTRGPNFGHNLSLYKVRYSLSNSRILYANLKDQWLRDYVGLYARAKTDTLYKRLILKNGALASRSGTQPYGPSSTYNVIYSGEGSLTHDSDPDLFNAYINDYLPNFRDPCCNVNNILSIGITRQYGDRYSNKRGTGGMQYIFYGAEGACKIYTMGRGECIYIYSGSNSIEGSNYTAFLWYGFDLDLTLNCQVTIGRYEKAEPGETGMFQHYLKNGMEKELILQNPTPYEANTPYLANSSGVVQDATIWECLQKNGNPSDGTGGIYLVRLPSNLSNQIVAGDYICFNGDGALDVIVSPLPGTIKFDCMNEDKMTHELYKEYNFCIEPSQMTNNGDGQQYVSYTASNCNVTATYEYTNRMRIALTKPSEIPSVKWEIYGHKKEMKWTISKTRVASHPFQGDGFRFDGTRVYRANTYGNGEVCYSDDFGVTWQAFEDIELYTGFRHADLPNAVAFTCHYDDMYISYDNKHYVILPDQFSAASDRSGFGAGFKWSRNADAAVKYMQIFNQGKVSVSNDGFTWTNAESLPDTSDKYYNGAYYINGKWWTVNAATGKLYYLDNGTWKSKTPTGFKKSWVHSTYEAGLAYGSNIMMLISRWNRNIATSIDEFTTANWRNIDDVPKVPNFVAMQDICYANGNFIIGQQQDNGNCIAYTTYHDGVMWINKTQGYSREINSKIGFNWVNNVDLDINMTNSVVTSIKGTYVEIVKKYEKAIEYKKIRLPEMSAYLDYSTNPYTRHIASGPSDNNSYWTGGNGWIYDTKEGFYLNKSKDGHHTQMYFGIHGDHGSLTYSDEAYDIVYLSANGWMTYDNKAAGRYGTSGLSRTYTSFKDFVCAKGRTYNDYKGTAKTISLMLQTMTLPINAALWAGASGSDLHNYQWQSDGSENWNEKDATDAVKEVTKSACAKLKSDWGDNLHVYLIKYRKQTQYKNRVTQATEDFDYDYLNACATENSDDYIYDITETDPAAAQTQLNQKLQAIADHIKEWAGYTEARNVEG